MSMDVAEGELSRDDRRVFMTTAFVVMLAFSLGAALQTVFVYRPARLEASQPIEVGLDLSLRLAVNLVTVALALALCHLLRLAERPARGMAALTLGIAVVVGSIRFALQCAAGLYPEPMLRDAAVEVGATVMVVVLAVAVARALVAARRRIREQAEEAAEQRLRAAAALASLATEESRVRQEVADDLHGTLQGRIVLVQAQIDGLLRAHAADGDAGALRAGLERVREELDRIRETEIRAVSHRLHPAGVAVGLPHALRLLVRTIPAEIEVETVIAPAAALAGPRPDADVLVRRVALLRAAEEAVTNALRHGRASRLRLELDRPSPDLLRVRVDDDGSGLAAAASRNGVALVADRLDALGGGVELGPSPLGGARLVATVPERAEAPTSAVDRRAGSVDSDS
jgi:signal transduction histidine kinase